MRHITIDFAKIISAIMLIWLYCHGQIPGLLLAALLIGACGLTVTFNRD
jgi:hypothetical protein